MRLLDSNVLIDALKPDHAERCDPFVREEFAVSAITYVEVLGYHRLSASDQRHLESLFAGALVLAANDPVVHEAVRLRQLRRMGLADALIAATALVHDLALVTRDTKDFATIDGLTVIDPLAPN